MTFNLSAWKELAKEQLLGWKLRMEQAGITSCYFFLASVSLIPLIQAVHGGDWSGLSVLGASLAGAVSTNLLANIVQKAKDKSDVEIARLLEDEVHLNPELRSELDVVLEKLNTLQDAEAALSEVDKAWFGETIQRQLNNLGSTVSYEATNTGAGAIAQNHSWAAGERAVLTGGDIKNSIIITGDNVNYHTELVTQAKKDSLRTSYMNYILETVSPLPLSGVVRQSAGKAEMIMNLSAVYTALLTQITREDISGEQKVIEYKAEWTSQQAGETAYKQLSAVECINKYGRLVILGEPGSGKSTFVNFVALCMAGDALGRKDVNLQTLTAPLPLEQNIDEWTPDQRENLEAQPWEHGALIPVRIILRDFVAQAFSQKLDSISAEDMWNFIVSELQSVNLKEFAPLLKAELQERGGLILFDGLDEVMEAEHRRELIRSLLENFAASFPRCRYLLTSRTYAYQRQDWKLRSFDEAVLAPFTKGQVKNFVEHWYSHIAYLRKQDQQDARRKAQVLASAIFASDRLMGLAERPLLLTLMASLHAWRGGTLPDKREKLYADAVDLLLERWESQRITRDPESRKQVVQPSLAEWLRVDRDKVRELLNQLAYEAHDKQTNLKGTADISETELIDHLMKLSQSPDPDIRPARLIEYLRDRAGLLIPRGIGVYTFPHRTFQEYLAACFLTDHDYPDLIAELARNSPDRWREVALLAGAKAATGAAVFALWSLVDSLSPELETAESNAAHWGAQIAGQAVAEIADLEKAGISIKPKLERLRTRLMEIIVHNRLPANERLRTGINLCAVGDPRFNSETWYLPNDDMLGFTLIQAGKFLMGSNSEDSEKPIHEVDLLDFWMAKYPVTIAQFRAFTQETGYFFDRWQLNKINTQPVTAVTWYEAFAYTKWLDKKLQLYAEEQIRSGTSNILWQGICDGTFHLTLPSEAEWEKAARGTDGRIFPCEGNMDFDKANIAGQFGEKSVVGCFPLGASPYGLLDMSGNVWEWTRSLWGKDWRQPLYRYPYDPSKFSREDLKADGEMLRVLRGGSFLDVPEDARCASRTGDGPNFKHGSYGFRVAVSSFYL